METITFKKFKVVGVESRQIIGNALFDVYIQIDLSRTEDIEYLKSRKGELETMLVQFSTDTPLLVVDALLVASTTDDMSYVEVLRFKCKKCVEL
jgi:hypothetical protein